MASLQAKLIYTFIRSSWLHKEELHKKNLLQIRNKFKNGKLGRLLFSLSGTKITQIKIEGVKIEEIKTNEITNKVILYAHGGGFVFERVSAHLSLMSYLSKQAKVRVISVNYKLAPENTFPTQIHEIEKVYNHLLKNRYSSQDIFFAGDSAGTNLIISTALLLKKNKKPLPKGIILISPTTDGTFLYPSFMINQNTETMLSQQKMRFFYDSYKGQEDVKNPLISPIFADLRGLPKTQIFVSDNELLFDDANNFYKNLKKARVISELHVGEGLCHAYPLLAKYIPEAQKSINEMVRFIYQK